MCIVHVQPCSKFETSNPFSILFAILLICQIDHSGRSALQPECHLENNILVTEFESGDDDAITRPLAHF